MRIYPSLKPKSDLSVWRDHFAWWPVRTESGIWVWLEPVDRRQWGRVFTRWLYRLPSER